jgi:hypothetical protein
LSARLAWPTKPRFRLLRSGLLYSGMDINLRLSLDHALVITVCDSHAFEND